MSTIDVDPAEALAEGQEGGKPAADKGDVLEAPKPLTQQEVLDTIQPMSAPRRQVVRTTTSDGEVVEYAYMQRELSFIGKAQWFSLVGEVMDRALGGDNRLSLEALFAPPEGWGEGGMNLRRMSEADTFMHALAKLIRFMPDFLEESFVIWLNVPDYDAEIVKGLMKQSKEDGGIGDDDGFAMIETFIDQNWAALEDWFTGKFDALRKRIETKTGTNSSASLSRPSTPSSSTQGLTRSA